MDFRSCGVKSEREDVTERMITTLSKIRSQTNPTEILGVSRRRGNGHAPSQTEKGQAMALTHPSQGLSSEPATMYSVS